jgi:hypothetical protein
VADLDLDRHRPARRRPPPPAKMKGRFGSIPCSVVVVAGAIVRNVPANLIDHAL